MKAKKTKKAAKKPRPKTVTVKTWRLVDPEDGWVAAWGSDTKAEALKNPYSSREIAGLVLARVTITYEVRR